MTARGGFDAMNLRHELHYQYRCLRLGLGFLTGRFIHCNLQITYRCNFKCQICDFWKTRTIRPTN